MGNSWTRLTEEAKMHGGPDALRLHYQSIGLRGARLSGLAIAIGSGVVLGVMEAMRSAKLKRLEAEIAALKDERRDGTTGGSLIGIVAGDD